MCNFFAHQRQKTAIILSSAPNWNNIDTAKYGIVILAYALKCGQSKCKPKPSQYINNIIELDHRVIKRKIKPGLGFFSYPTAWRTIQGYEAMHMIRKEQIQGADKGNIRAQNEFIAGLFGLAV